jgi:hypothetical protein
MVSRYAVGVSLTIPVPGASCGCVVHVGTVSTLLLMKKKNSGEKWRGAARIIRGLPECVRELVLKKSQHERAAGGLSRQCRQVSQALALASSLHVEPRAHRGIVRVVMPFMPFVA